MSEIVKRYTRDGVTVVWKPDVCIHSTICFKGLPRVFNPNKRPWINMEGSELEKIKQQVANCPSGAISIETNEETPVQAANNNLVEVLVNGPLCVHGSLKVKHADGTEENKSTKTFFCRCGQSSKKPYCDGTHKKIEFVG
jgi:uncharacterized Fe-S cluster protein YjdI